MVCLGNMCMDTLHKEEDDDDDGGGGGGDDDDDDDYDIYLLNAQLWII